MTTHKEYEYLGNTEYEAEMDLDHAFSGSVAFTRKDTHGQVTFRVPTALVLQVAAAYVLRAAHQRLDKLEPRKFLYWATNI